MKFRTEVCDGEYAAGVDNMIGAVWKKLMESEEVLRTLLINENL